MFVLFLAGLAVGSPERPVIGVLTVPLDDGCETMNGHSLASSRSKVLKEQGAAACFTAFYGKPKCINLKGFRCACSSAARASRTGR